MASPRPVVPPQGGARPVVAVDRLTRSFRVTDRDPGLGAAVKSVFRRRFRTIEAVDDVSFTVEPGEILAFLGPNGAGKTTVLKCVAGLLTPTSGTVEVLGHVPSQRESSFLRRLGFVMGQRWQLHPDLPVADSLEIHRVTYDIGDDDYAQSRRELVELLDLEPLLTQPARELSLGQRMRCEFAAALIHRPGVVLLDEPTLGLDFEAQVQIRNFVAEYAERHHAAVLLTSHYLADIEALSHRALTISAGRITFEGTFADLRSMAGDRKRLTARLREPMRRDPSPLGVVLEQTDARVVLDVARSDSGPALTAMQGFEEVIDVSVADPPIEEKLTDLYASSER